MATGIAPVMLGMQLQVMGHQQAAQQLGAVGNKVSGLQKNVSQFARGLRDTMGGVRQMSQSFMVPMAAAAGGFALMAREAIAFNTSVTRAGMPFGKEGFVGNYEKISRLAKTVATEMPFTASEVANSIASMVKAGYSLSGATDVLRSGLHIAQTEAMDTDQAMGVLITTLAKYNLSTSQATWAANTMSRASDASLASITTMAESLKYASAGAQALGVDLTETSALLAVLSNQGYKGSVAGTQLNRVFFSLINARKSLKLKELGFDIEDKVTKKLKPMRQILVELTAAFRSIKSKKEQGALAESIFGTRGVQAFNALMVSGISTYDKMVKDIEKGVPTVADKADLLANSFEGLGKQLWASVGVLGIDLFETFGSQATTTLKDTVKFVRETATAFTVLGKKPWLKDTDKEFKGARGSAIAFAKGLQEAVKEVIPTLKDLWGKIKSVVEWFSDDNTRLLAKWAGKFALLAPVFTGATLFVNAFSNLTGGAFQALIGLGRAGSAMAAGAGGAGGAASAGLGGTLSAAGFVQKVNLVTISAAAGATIGMWINSILGKQEVREGKGRAIAHGLGGDFERWAMDKYVRNVVSANIQAQKKQKMVEVPESASAFVKFLAKFQRVGSPQSKWITNVDEMRYATRQPGTAEYKAQGAYLNTNMLALQEEWNRMMEENIWKLKRGAEGLWVSMARAEHNAAGWAQVAADAAAVFRADWFNTGKAFSQATFNAAEKLNGVAFSLEELRNATNIFWASLTHIFETNFFKAFLEVQRARPIKVDVKLDSNKVGAGLGKSALTDQERRGSQLPPWQRRAILEHGAIQVAPAR